MTKEELVSKIAKECKITKTQAHKAINSFTDGITKALKMGKKVSLVGFGTWSVAKRKARTGRNPQTGAMIKIAAARVPKFKAGKQLKKAVKY
jgi:DNA-binding protein HU-beta